MMMMTLQEHGRDEQLEAAASYLPPILDLRLYPFEEVQKMRCQEEETYLDEPKHPF